MKRDLFAYLTCALLITSGQVLGQTCNPNIVKTKPDSQYELLNNGTEVKDKKTGLIWQRCALGMSWDGTTCSGTATFHTWEGALAQAATVATNTSAAWRLPSPKELKSLVETACYGQAINATIFPATPGPLWSSSSYPGYTDGAWCIEFEEGWNDMDSKGGEHDAVRLVRGE